MEEQRELILNGNLRSLLFKFSMPAIIGMLVNALYNMVDTLFVGQGVGPLAISALTIVLPMQIIMMSFGIMTGIGSSSVISRAFGAKDYNKALKSVGSGIVLTVFFSLIFLIPAYIFADKILYFFGASSETFTFAYDYMSIILIGFITYSLVIFANSIIRAEGKPRASMYVMIIGAACNIILDPIFIFILKLGVKGAAIATIISQFISLLFVLAFFISKKSSYILKISHFNPDLKISREIIAVGFPSFILQILSSVIFLIFNKSLVYYGTDMHVAVMGIGLRMTNFIEMPIIGITQGYSTLVSFNYGAKLYTRIKKIFKEAFIWTFIIAGAGFIIMMLFPEQVLGLFTKDKSLIQMGIMPLRIIIIFLPFIGFQVLGGSLFQAIGKTIPALIITLSRQLLLLIPALIVLPIFFNINGIWFAIPVSSFFSIILTSFFVYFQIRKFNELSEVKPMF